MVYHPNDEEDPTAEECNYNFAQVLFAFIVGVAAMFLMSVNEIQKFKGCTYESRSNWTRTNGRRNVPPNENQGQQSGSMGIQEKL